MRAFKAAVYWWHPGSTHRAGDLSKNQEKNVYHAQYESSDVFRVDFGYVT